MQPRENSCRGRVIRGRRGVRHGDGVTTADGGPTFAPGQCRYRYPFTAASEEIRLPREIDNQDGVRWSCAQAYEGLSDDNGGGDAARIEGKDLYRVVCTPSGGSMSVELELPVGWDDDLTDEDLLEMIRRSQK